jgi:5-enolpyruvylshikimate-3-phosphate synthase
MTRKLCAVFPVGGGEFAIEPDASSASYIWAGGWLAPAAFRLDTAPDPSLDEALENFLMANLGQPCVRLEDIASRRELWKAALAKSGKECFAGALRWLDYLESHSDVSVRGTAASGWQIDNAFRRFWPLPREVSRQSDLGDSIMTAMILAPFASEPTRFVGLAPLRLQECERVAAMRTELSKCGVEVLERGNELTVFPSAAKIHGAEIETYNDHRMAMCFAILGLKVAGVRIQNPACVKKTFPNFFQKLAAPQPGGFGVEIRDARSGRRLTAEDLFAD